MQEKTKLITSISNLINHVSISRSNQEQIFKTLSQHDFKKILTNLEDANEKLRKITLILLAELLHENHELKEKFCHIMNIHPCPGKVMFSSKLPKNILNNTRLLSEFYVLLKQGITIQHNHSYLWYINPHKTPLTLNFLNKGKFDLDPLDYVIGFIIPSLEYKKSSTSSIYKPKIMISSAKAQKFHRMNHSFQQHGNEKRTVKDRSAYSKNSSTRMSLEEDITKYKVDSGVKSRGNSKINSNTEKKVPPLEIDLNHSYKDFDRSIKYIKPSYISPANQTICITHRTPTLQSAKLSESFRGNETTRDRSKNVGQFFKPSETNSYQNIVKYQPVYGKNSRIPPY